MSHKLTNRQLRSLKKGFEHKERRQETKEARRQRAQERSTRPSRTPRPRDWSEADDAASFERIRRAKAGETRPATSAAPEPSGPLATVIEVRSGDSLVSYEGQVLRAMLPLGSRAVDPATRSPLAVGDRVHIEAGGTDTVRIAGVAPRRSALTRDVADASRPGAASLGQVIAANIDQAVIVCSPAEPPFRPRLIDRYLVAASRDGLPAVICLNKTDLGLPEEIDKDLRGYERLGVRVARASASTGDGVDALREAIAGKVSLFTGHSGVGKSSLLNALEPGLALRVGTVTESTAGQGKGRHTTTSARLVPLSLAETFVVDTPGIRSFGIRGLAARELAPHFADIAALADGCAYRDCLHRGEPGCAVDDASRSDAFLRARVASYRALLRELR